jgi:hypothetical protein
MVMVGRTATADGRVVHWEDEEWLVSGSIAPRPGIETDLRFPVYDELPPSALGDGLLSLEAQHPGAAVKVDKLAYEARWSELAPPKPCASRTERGVDARQAVHRLPRGAA